MDEKIKDFTIRLANINLKNTKANTELFDEVKALAETLAETLDETLDETNSKLATCLLGFMYYFNIGTEHNLANETWSKIIPLNDSYEFLPGYFLDNINSNFEVKLPSDNPIILMKNKRYTCNVYDEFINLTKHNFYMAIAKVSYIPELAYSIAMSNVDINIKMKYLEIAAEYNYEKAILTICNLYEYPPNQNFETKQEFIKTLREINLSNAKKAWEYLVNNYRSFDRYDLELCKFIYRHPELNYDRYADNIFYNSKHYFAESYTLLAIYVLTGRITRAGGRNTAYHYLTLGAQKGDLEACFFIGQWFKKYLDNSDDAPNRWVLCMAQFSYVMYEGAKIQSYDIIMRAYRELLTFDKDKANHTLECIKKIWPEFGI